jgi:intracellular multiplication protein IcmE
MTDNEDQNDIDLDDDLGATGPGKAPAKASLKEAWQGNPLLKVGAAVIAVGVAVAGYTIITKPNPVEEAKSFVNAGDTKNVKAIPGKDNPDSAYKKAVETKNAQRAEVAAQTGGSAIPTPIATGKDQGLPIPQAGGRTAADPLQEWKNNVQARKIRSEEANIEDDMATAPPQPELVPLVQPVHPQAVVKMDPQVAAALSAQMRTIIATQRPGHARIMSITPQKSAWDVAQDVKKKLAAGTTGGTAGGGAGGGAAGGQASAAAQKKIIMSAGQIFYAQLLLELNSDIPSPAMATVMSGPFAGGRAIGSMSKKDDYLVISFNRIVKDDVNYRISGIALDEATTLPAIPGEVDHHYFNRLILPAAAKFVASYTDSLAQTGTTTTTTSGGGVATAQPKPTVKESLNKGLAGVGNTLSEFMTEGAKKDITVRVTRGATMGVMLLDAVTTADVEGGGR